MASLYKLLRQEVCLFFGADSGDYEYWLHDWRRYCSLRGTVNGPNVTLLMPLFRFLVIAHDLDLAGTSKQPNH